MQKINKWIEIKKIILNTFTTHTNIFFTYIEILLKNRFRIILIYILNHLENDETFEISQFDLFISAITI